MEGTVVQSAIRTPGKGTDRYWGKLGCGGGVFSFSEGAPQQPPSEGGKRRTKRRTRTRTRRKRGRGSRRMEAAAGGGGKIRRSAFRIARGWDEEYDGERRNLAVPIGIRCVISAVSIIIHTVVAVPSHPCRGGKPPADSPSYTDCLSRPINVCGRPTSLFLSLFQCEGPSPTPSSSTLDSGNRPSRKTRHW